MSRVGRKPVAIPDKVKVDVRGDVVSVSGPLGNLDMQLPEGVDATVADGAVSVGAPPRTRHNSGYQGLVRSLLSNMVEGVTKGYQRTLTINGVGYKCEQQGNNLKFTLGYTHTNDIELPAGVTAEVDKPQTTVTIKGIDKQVVNQIAAKIRGFKIPEPYKAKGVKYAEEIIRRKVGKAGAK